MHATQSATEEFASNFRSLTGLTVGERRKNLFLLLENTRRHGASGEIDFSSLQAATPLEESFKVEALIYFRRIPELVEVLKSEQPALIAKVLRNSSWFLEEAFRNVTAEQLVADVFPYISFNTKVKILNKLSVYLEDTKQADDLFQVVDKKYGFYLASKILPSCSADLILRTIKCSKRELTPRQTLTVIRKQPAIIESLLKEIHKSTKVSLTRDYQSLFKYIAKSDIELFKKLYKEYELSFYLGWRLTDRIVRKNKTDIINDPKKYYKWLHNEQIAKSMGHSFKNLYINLFPSTLHCFNSSYSDIFHILKKLPVKMRNADLLISAFVKVYQKEIWECPDYVTSDLLNMLSAVEREKYLRVEGRPSNIKEERWMSYMKTEISIPYLKKSISLTSDIKTRAELVGLLVETCRINEDDASLAKVCAYVLTKHRNDHASVRLKFLHTILKGFKLQNLDEHHWTPINELLQIIAVNKEQFYYGNEFLEGYIYFRLEKNLPVDEQLLEWKKTHYNSFNIIKEKPEHEKKCLLLFGELISRLSLNAEDEKLNWFSFLQALVDWNKRHPEDQLSLFRYSAAIKHLQNDVEVNYLYRIEPIINFILLQMRTDLDQKVGFLEFYFTKGAEIKINFELINLLIRNEPLTLVKYIECITRRTLQVYLSDSHYLFWRRCRYLSHLEIPQKIMQLCLSNPEDGAKDFTKETIARNSVIALSFLMNVDEFKTFISSFHPTKLCSNLTTEEGKKLYQKQEAVTLSLKNLNPRHAALEPILMYCKGDYLKLVQKSLYSVCNDVNEVRIPSFLTEIGTRAVSVRKHALHLTFRVLDKQHFFTVMKNFMDTEKNSSVRKFIFKGIFNYFALNRDEYSWQMVKESINAVDFSDEESFDILMQTSKVPEQYFIEYIPFAWDIINKLQKPESDKTSKRSSLLSALNSNYVMLLPKDFCNGIIDMYFFKGTNKDLTNFQSQIHTFTCRFIIYCDSQQEQEERLMANFEVVKNHAVAARSDMTTDAVAWNYVANFVKEFCCEFLRHDCKNVEVLKKFATLWNDTFEPHQTFDEYLHLQFTLICTEKLTLHEIGKRLSQLCDSLVDTYGPLIISVIHKRIDHFMCYFLKNEETNEKRCYALIESFVHPAASVPCLVLAVLLLNDNRPDETNDNYNAIIKMLESRPEPLIKIYIHNHVKKSTTMDYY